MRAFFIKLTHIIIFLLLAWFNAKVFAADHALVIEVQGAITPAMQDHIIRGLDSAAKEGAKVVILQMDTPGGLDSAQRHINKAILSSKIPVITFVAPTGARAASAGTYILYASHLAAMAPGTNLGAATPVNIGDMGSVGSNDDKNNSNKNSNTKSTMEKKTEEDAAAYIRSLAAIHHRNEQWAEKAVRESVSLSSEEALKLKVIDVIAKDIPDLLKTIQGRAVIVLGEIQHLQTDNISIKNYVADWRFDFLSVITDPTIAYILLLMGIYGLFFEFANPGFVLPGVVGAVSLILALYAFQLLPINYAGFALLIFGIACMVAEAYIASFGALGIGGVVAFAIGSILLLDSDLPGYAIAWQVILAMTIISALFFLLMMNLAIRATRKVVVTGREALIGAEGIIIENNASLMMVRIQGEIWQAKSSHHLILGQKVRVTEISGLLLTVEPF